MFARDSRRIYAYAQLIGDWHHAHGVYTRLSGQRYVELMTKKTAIDKVLQ